MQLLTSLISCLLLVEAATAMNKQLIQLMDTDGFQTCLGYNSTYDNLDHLSKQCYRIIQLTEKYGNMTRGQINMMYSLGRELQLELTDLGRNKRNIRPLRIRKECRTLSERQRTRIFSTIVQMKQGPENMYDVFARIHLNNQVLENAHVGSNFPGWHRIYLLFFENALRRIDPGVVLCYWDPTLDFSMPSTLQLHSVTFSDRLFGNGYATVINGPFRNWQLISPYGFRLRRNIGQMGSLTRPKVADLIAFDPKIIRTTQILTGSGARGFTDPDTGRRHSLEQCHDLTHAYLGGVFSSLPVTAQDPVFWFFHAYVDYLWELFRQKQWRHGIDPSRDYPEHGGEDHRAFRNMVPFFAFRNIDGYSNSFTEKIYRYASSPVCGNRCGGASNKFLYCPRGRHRRSRCVSQARNVDIIPNETLKKVQSPILKQLVSGNEASKAIVNVYAFMIAMEDGRVNLPKPLFSANFNDPRVFVENWSGYNGG